MSYCAICGRHHETDSPCFGPAETGLPGRRNHRSSPPSRRAKDIAKKAERALLIALMLVLAAFALSLLIFGTP